MIMVYFQFLMKVRKQPVQVHLVKVKVKVVQVRKAVHHLAEAVTQAEVILLLLHRPQAQAQAQAQVRHLNLHKTGIL